MTDTPKRLYGPAQPGTGDAALYTVPGSTTAIIRNIHICNTTTADATISLGVNGTSATAANCFLKGFTIPANGEYDWPGSLVLTTGQTLNGLQGTSSALTVIVSGVEVT